MAIHEPRDDVRAAPVAALLHNWCHIDARQVQNLPATEATAPGQFVFGITVPTPHPRRFGPTEDQASYTVLAQEDEIGEDGATRIDRRPEIMMVSDLPCESVLPSNVGNCPQC
jgi:hypothetical protein